MLCWTRARMALTLTGDGRVGAGGLGGDCFLVFLEMRIGAGVTLAGAAGAAATGAGGGGLVAGTTGAAAVLLDNKESRE